MGHSRRAARPASSALSSQIRLPTLVVVGEDDAISPPAEMRGVSAVIRGAEFVAAPDTRHMAPLENPATFKAALEKFLAIS